MTIYEQRIIDWAADQPDIRVVLVVGSQARRGDHPPDALSDLDLALYTDQWLDYADISPFLEMFGKAWLCLPEPRDDGLPEHLVMLDKGMKIDLLFMPISHLDALTRELEPTFIRGYRVLVDKDGWEQRLIPSPFARVPVTRPTDREFEQVVTGFWYEAYQMAKFLWRGDLWRVKLRDARLKEHLLTMIEWHAQELNGWAGDTWHDGRFLQEWAAPQVWEAAQEVFAHFDAEDSWRALWASIDLFRKLARAVASGLDMTCLVELEQRMMTFIRACETGGIGEG